MPDDTRPKPFAFILMPFEKKFEDVYKLGIKQACFHYPFKVKIVAGQPKKPQ